MQPVELILKKRNGGEHSAEELNAIAKAAATGEGMTDYQLSAWLMAVVWRGMTPNETHAYTMALAESGEHVDLTGLPEPWVDKHSTGGVGDKTTLILLPILAACGLTVVKMSGRGLGITGGTIDKLEAIPGFRTQLNIQELKRQAGDIGIALTGQTPNLAPADGRLYALRDVTGTVDSIPLIAASVMSKKIAGGAKNISLDIKCGSGAFMKTLDDAKALAEACVDIGRRASLRVGAEITDMDQPLGRSVGNLIEVQEAVRCLMNRATPRLTDFIIDLAASTLVLSRDESWENATTQARRALESGAALDFARRWWNAQGATIEPEALLEMPLAPVRRTLSVLEEGWVARLDAAIIGQTALVLGAGRLRKEDAIDPSVGIEVHTQVSDYLAPNEQWATIFARNEQEADHAAQQLTGALVLSSDQPKPHKTVIDRLMP